MCSLGPKDGDPSRADPGSSRSGLPGRLAESVTSPSRSSSAPPETASISNGKDPDIAERWCDAWEAEAALRDLKRDGDYWEAGKLWIDADCTARKQPPS